MTKLTRTALAALAAVGVIAATAVVGVASAAAADTVQTPSLELSALITQLSTSDDPRLPVVDDYTTADVRLIGTRTGSILDWLECERYVDAINGLIALAFRSADLGHEVVSRLLSLAVQALNEAEEFGCVIL